jgi:hypothetical protein
MSELASAKEEFLFVVSGEMLVIASLFGINGENKRLIDRGGHIRGIDDIPYSQIELVIAASTNYKTSMSPLYQWFVDECVVEDFDGDGNEVWTPTHELYDSYKTWRTAVGEKVPCLKNHMAAT